MNNEEMVYLPFFFYQFTFNERAFIKQMLIHTGFGKKYVISGQGMQCHGYPWAELILSFST